MPRRTENSQPRSWIGGIPQPTDAEIAEGRAKRELLMDPDNECLVEMHRRAWNALQGARTGGMGLLRCSLCHTTLWGQFDKAPCPVCKCKSSYYLGGNQ